MAVPFLACMLATATFYGLPPRALPAIQSVEGGRVGSVHLNADGSEDYGVMQVNSRWLNVLGRFTGESAPATRARLVNDPCFNIAAAGAILRTYLNEAGGDVLLAVGYYHSHTQVLRESYLGRVMRSAGALFGDAR
jgi:soluble lytic murein transglycosylase-like protein